MSKKLKTLSTDSLEISYTKYGKGNNLILFVHGWSCDQTYWKNQIEFFKNNYQVVTLDLGGHGNSGTNRKNWTISSFGDDVVSVVNQFKYRSLYMVGHSMGGMVVLDAASKLDSKRMSLFLVDEIKKRYWPVPEETFQDFIKPFIEDFRNHTKERVKTDDNFIEDSDPELIEWISTDMSSAPPEIAIPSLYDLRTRNFDETIAQLRKRNISMTLINNKESEERDKRELMQLGFRTEIIPKVGHFIMLEKPEEFNQTLFELIKSK
ncbi:MAG: alpha/beta fold hydrolase [Ignavibacteria bacterium]